MALQTDAIESRLEALKQDDRRMMFDSKLRAFRLDSKAAVNTENRGVKTSRNRADPPYPVEQIISLLEDLSRRIDGLERRDRALGDVLRRKARRESRRRSILTIGGLIGLGGFLTCWMMKLI